MKMNEGHMPLEDIWNGLSGGVNRLRRQPDYSMSLSPVRIRGCETLSKPPDINEYRGIGK